MMYQLRVIVPELNIRNSPDADPTYGNRVGSLMKGTTFYAETLIQGGTYETSNNWYADTMNRYYWAGGVTVLSEITTPPKAPAVAAQPSPAFPQWMNDLCIPDIWQYATGNGVGVAVVDTGITPGNADLPYNTERFFTYDPAVSVTDTNGHGTNCAGLIGARNSTGKYIGVAPGTNLFVCKISDIGFFNNPAYTQRYADAINWCVAQDDIHIISISWANPVFDPAISKAIQDAVTNAVSKNKIVVCAMGDASGFGDDTQMLPACCNGPLGIGAIPVPGKLYPYINSYLLATVNGYGMQSYGITPGTANLYGTSQANAVVAGIIALMIERNNFSYTPASIRKDLQAMLETASYTINDKTAALPVIKGTSLLQYFTRTNQ